MWIDILIFVCGGLVLVVGYVGCVVPVLPGPPIAYIALLLRAIQTDGTPPLTIKAMIIFAVIAVAVTLFDNIVPIIGARRYGATIWGIVGCIVGMIIGLIFFPFFGLGLIIGGILGAAGGELLRGQTREQAFKASLGTFLGTLLGVVAKIIVCSLFTFYFIYAFLG